MEKILWYCVRYKVAKIKEQVPGHVVREFVLWMRYKVFKYVLFFKSITYSCGGGVGDKEFNFGNY